MSSAHPIPQESSAPARSGLHRFAVVLACAVVLLIAAGALVKSKEAGLSVPDWPLSYGSLNPPRWWQIDTVRSEHGHRLFAGTVALLTVALAVWASRAEPRRWVRRLAWGAVGAVLAQALLGGITVLLFLPPAVSISHAALAQLFLCIVTTLAVATSPGFLRATSPAGEVTAELARLRTLAAATVAAVYCQILLGAVVRHFDAGLAIPDFPLVFGGLVPAHFTFPVAVHYAHRVGGMIVAILVFTTAAHALGRLRGQGWLRRPALALCGLVALQIALGGSVVLTGRAVIPNTVHVATGAALLATSLVLALRTARLARLAALGAKARGAKARGAKARGAKARGAETRGAETRGAEAARRSGAGEASRRGGRISPAEVNEAAREAVS